MLVFKRLNALNNARCALSCPILIRGVCNTVSPMAYATGARYGGGNSVPLCRPFSTELYGGGESGSAVPIVVLMLELMGSNGFTRSRKLSGLKG